MQLQIVNYIAATSSGGIVQTIAVVVSIILQRQRLRDNRGGPRHIRDVVCHLCLALE